MFLNTFQSLYHLVRLELGLILENQIYASPEMYNRSIAPVYVPGINFHGGVNGSLATTSDADVMAEWQDNVRLFYESDRVPAMLYLRSVPRLKPLGSATTSVFVSTFAMLSVLWTIFSLIAGALAGSQADIAEDPKHVPSISQMSRISDDRKSALEEADWDGSEAIFAPENEDKASLHTLSERLSLTGENNNIRMSIAIAEIQLTLARMGLALRKHGILADSDGNEKKWVELEHDLTGVELAWNSGTCFYMMWAALACLNQFVNSIAWTDGVLNKAPIWFGISAATIRITMGASAGIPAASLCINRRLYQFVSVRTVSITPAKHSSTRSYACSSPRLCRSPNFIVLPFNLYEQIGCYPALYNSVPMYLLSMMWPPLIGLVSAAYGALALRAFLRRRTALSQFLFPLSSPSSSYSSNGLTPSRYLRLMALALTAALPTTPLDFVAIYLKFPSGQQIHAILWRESRRLVLALEFSRWASPTCALVFFEFFGFTVEARRHYALFFVLIITAFWRGAARLGVQRPASGFLAAASPKGNFGSASSKGLGGPSAKAKGGFSLSPSSASKSTSKAPPSAAASKSISNPVPIALPTYSFDGTGSFTDLGTLSTASASTSRFVERFEGEPETPVTATSFASTPTETQTHEYALPLYCMARSHVPRVARLPAYPYIVGGDGEEGGEGEEAQWSPASDAHSISMETFSGTGGGGGGGRMLV
ncbi:pheromone A receptor-domain-containing protein [Mycena vulgaris]|nr:pheromone A receptor-domain-containing protein [Mycena vulgaris]